MSCVCKYDISVPCNDKSIYSCDMCKEHPMYEQGRADAIEEYKNRLLELCDGGEECIECVGGKCTECFDNRVDYSTIVVIANELMEGNNARFRLLR